MKNTHFLGLFVTITGVTLLSLESLFIKLTTVSALTFAFYSSIFMFVSSNTILLVNKKSNFLTVYKSDFKAILICSFLLGVSNIFFISAIKNTTVANAVIIFSTAPIFAAFYMYVLFREKSTKNIYISTFFIFVGLYVTFTSQIGEGETLGNIYACICISLFSLAFVVLSRYKDINIFAVISVSSIIVVLISFFISTNIDIDMYSLYILLLSGLLVAPFSRLFMGMGTKMLPASEVSLLMIIETIMAPVWVWVFLNEVPKNSTLIGGIIILLTLVVNSLYVLHVNKKVQIGSIEVR